MVARAAAAKPYSLGAVVRLRKPHPCGGREWEITRLGADIGLSCLTCRRRVLMPRPTLDKRVKTVVSLESAERTGGG